MEFIGGLVRTAIAAFAGGLIANGTIEAETVNQVTGAIMVLITAGWSLWQKKQTKK